MCIHLGAYWLHNNLTERDWGGGVCPTRWRGSPGATAPLSPVHATLHIAELGATVDNTYFTDAFPRLSQPTVQRDVRKKYCLTQLSFLSLVYSTWHPQFCMFRRMKREG